jgi:ABC-type bacteriocin/lantibiotic exporter with double-glycine peptidase domain
MLKVKPHKQKPGMCGPACLKMVFGFFGINKTEKDLAKLAHSTVLHGTKTKNMLSAARACGFRAKKIDQTTTEQLRYYVLEKKIPVIVRWFNEDTGHYSVVVHIDQRYIYMQDPDIGKINKMDLKRFESLWFDFEGEFRIRKKRDLIEQRMLVVWK